MRKKNELTKEEICTIFHAIKTQMNRNMNSENKESRPQK